MLHDRSHDHGWKCSTPSLPSFLLPPCCDRDDNDNSAMSMPPPCHHCTLRLPTTLHDKNGGMRLGQWRAVPPSRDDKMPQAIPLPQHDSDTTMTFWSCPPPHCQALLPVYDMTSWQWQQCALGHTPPLQPNDDNVEPMLLLELLVPTRCRDNSEGMNQWGRTLTWCLILLQVDWGAITWL